MPGTGIPPGASPAMPGGCVDNRVIVVNQAGQIVREDDQGINVAAFASRLNGDHTLITSAGDSHIFEINKNFHITWQYYTNTAPNSNPSPSPTNAVRLATGNTEIADQFNDRAIIVDENGNLVYQYGVTNVPGNGPGKLNAPYTAFTIGDYTGQTVPPPVF